MTDNGSSTSALTALDLPNPESQRRFAALVGVDVVTSTLKKDLLIDLDRSRLEQWATTSRLPKGLVSLVQGRSRVYILAGDVGTGKTEIGETIGDPVARETKLPVTLFRLGLGARGSGLVGEMSRLISGGFAEILESAKRWRAHNGKVSAAGILFIDEADALAQSRELSQMHHEDRAGVNALIRGVDDLARADVPVAIILATNRLSSLDPAVRRRAARTFELGRPNEPQRLMLLQRLLHDVPSPKQIPELVALTGATATRPYGFTYSDIVARLVPDAVLSAYPSEAFTVDHVISIAKTLVPTPPFKET